MNVVGVWFEYQGITRTADIQDYFHSYLDKEMIYNIYGRFMIRSAEGRERTIVDSNDDYVDVEPW